jgi:hypothetical protein
LTLLSACTAGCSEELGRDPLVTTRVTGTVRVGSRPLTGGWVEFFPFDGAVGTLRSAPIRRDGRFELDGVAVGTNSIAIVGASVEPRYRWRFNALQTPMRRVIPGGPPVVLDIDLAVEYVRWDLAAVAADAR